MSIVAPRNGPNRSRRLAMVGTIPTVTGADIRLREPERITSINVRRPR